MAENSNIEWTDDTFNPWIGCTKVSAACDHCYAEKWDKRFGGERWGPHAPRRRTAAANWRKPLAWDKAAAAEGVRRKVFCASLADVFDNHRSITSGWRGDLWRLIAETPNLDWLLLTKRPQNIAKMLPETYGAPEWGDGWPNVWLGTTAENQEEADRRIPILLDTPAAKRFASMEPLLGPIDLRLRAWVPWIPHKDRLSHKPNPNTYLDWVIVGGESGLGARPMHPDWARGIRDQCAAAGTPFFFKQWGDWFPYGERDASGAINSVTRGERLGVWHEWGAEGGFSVRLPGGKKAAGRHLDGVTHDGTPAPEIATAFP